jgi:hypothetical protein
MPSSDANTSGVQRGNEAHAIANNREIGWKTFTHKEANKCLT